MQDTSRVIGQIIVHFGSGSNSFITNYVPYLKNFQFTPFEIQTKGSVSQSSIKA